MVQDRQWLFEGRPPIVDGRPVLCPGCTCDSCPELAVKQAWPHIYFDKNATGLNDGTSWTDAFTNIALVVNYPKYQIHIKGHGVTDPYTVAGNSISFDDDPYYWIFNDSVDDLYMNIEFEDATCCIFEDINIRNISQGFGWITYSQFTRVTVENSSSGWRGCNNCTFEECEANHNSGNGWYANSYGIFNNCIADTNFLSGFSTNYYGVFFNCTGSNSWRGSSDGQGWYNNNQGEFEECYAFGNAGTGFDYSSGIMLNCSSYENGENGYMYTTGILEGCSAVGNALAGYYQPYDATFFGCNSDDNVLQEGYLRSTRVDFEECSATGNGRCGWSLSVDCTFTLCTESDNGSSPGGCDV